MTGSTQKLIDSFEALPEAEKHEVLTHLLRRLINASYPSPSNDDLTHAADQVFQEYDRREAQG